MDLQKIIDSSLDQSVQDVVKGKLDDNLVYDTDDESIKGMIKSNSILMNFATVLLENYHEELKKELAKYKIYI